MGQKYYPGSASVVIFGEEGGQGSGIAFGKDYKYLFLVSRLLEVQWPVWWNSLFTPAVGEK
jgi:hypothetical protein